MRQILVSGAVVLAIGVGSVVAGCGSDGASSDDPQNTGGGDTSTGGSGTGGDGSGGGGGTDTHVPLDLGLAEPPVTGTFTDDRDGQTYQWVELNGVRWMAENLNIEPNEKQRNTSCWFNIDTLAEECERYGHFYGWSVARGLPAVADEMTVKIDEDGTYQGICPAGWHLPRLQDFNALFSYVTELADLDAPSSIFDATTFRGISEPFRSTTEWEDGFGTNELLFNAKPYREHDLGTVATFWASDEYGDVSGAYVDMYEDNVYTSHDFKFERYSIRCIEGEATEQTPVIPVHVPTNTTGTLTDARDDKTYATTQIGTQLWMAESLNYVPASGDSLCYGLDDEHCRLFGRMYGFETAQTVCPADFHLPTVEEWHTLATYVAAQTNVTGGGESSPGYFGWDIGESLIGLWVWDNQPDAEPTFGFNALPGGYGLEGSNGLAHEVSFWSASGSEEIEVGVSAGSLSTHPVRSGVEAYVRCVHD